MPITRTQSHFSEEWHGAIFTPIKPDTAVHVIHHDESRPANHATLRLEFRVWDVCSLFHTPTVLAPFESSLPAV